MWRKMKGARNEKRNPLLILYSPRFPLSPLHPLSLIPFAAHFTFNFSPSVWAHPVSPSLFSHLAFFFFHLFLSFSFSWGPSPHVYPHIFLCPSTLRSKGVWPPYFRCFVRFVDRYQMFYSQHETMTSLFPCKRLQNMRLLVHQEKLKNYDWKLFKQLQVFLVDVQTH